MNTICINALFMNVIMMISLSQRGILMSVLFIYKDNVCITFIQRFMNMIHNAVFSIRIFVQHILNPFIPSFVTWKFLFQPYQRGVEWFIVLYEPEFSFCQNWEERYL